MKFLLRLLKHLAILLLASIPLQILGLILVPVGILLSKDHRFPRALRFFDSADMYLPRDNSTYLGVIEKGFLSQYYWLAIRNPLNYFGYVVLGVENKGYDKLILKGDLAVGDSSGKHEGLLIQELLDQQKQTKAYEYYYIKKWNKDHCLRFRLGYKIGGINKDGDLIQQVLVLQPFKSYSGL